MSRLTKAEQNRNALIEESRLDDNFNANRHFKMIEAITTAFAFVYACWDGRLGKQGFNCEVKHDADNVPYFALTVVTNHEFAESFCPFMINITDRMSRADFEYQLSDLETGLSNVLGHIEEQKRLSEVRASAIAKLKIFTPEERASLGLKDYR